MEEEGREQTRKVSFIAYALTPSSQTNGPKVGKTNSCNASAQASAWQRLVHGGSLLGYSLLLSLCMVLHVLLVSLIDWQDFHRADGVPVLERTAPLWGVSVPTVISYSVCSCSLVAGDSQSPDSGLRYARVTLTIGAIIVPVSVGLCFLLATSFDLKYIGGDILVIACFCIFYVVSDVLGRRATLQRKRRRPAAAPLQQHQASPSPLTLPEQQPTVYRNAIRSVLPVFLVILTGYMYTTVLMPIFFSGGPTTRLMICLILHPFILESTEAMSRSTSSEQAYLALSRKEISMETAEKMVTAKSALNFPLKQLMTLFRRFMLLNMGTPEATIIAVVAASLEEALSRGFLVELDTAVRAFLGKPASSQVACIHAYRPDELRLQRLVWMSDSNQSAIAELNAILTSSFAQVLLQRHAAILALGYTVAAPLVGRSAVDTCAAPAVLDVALSFVQLMLELALEIIVDVAAMWAEGEHSIPVTEFFVRSSMQGRFLFLIHLSASVATFGPALYSFIRHPTFSSCASNFVCDCVEQPQYAGWFTAACADAAAAAAAASGGAANATDAPYAAGNSTSTGSGGRRHAIENELFASVDPLTILVAFVSGVAMLALIMLSTLWARYLRKRRAVEAMARRKVSLSNRLDVAQEETKCAEEQARRAEHQAKQALAEIAKLRTNLLAAQKTVDDIMQEGGCLLAPLRIRYGELRLGGRLGLGSYGVVLQGVYRGKDVAVKTVRNTKITKRTMAGFREELKVMAPIHHPNIVSLVGGCWDSPHELAIVLELCERGSLHAALDAAQPEFSWAEPYERIMLGAARCLCHLHHDLPGDPLMHRDIKPANILLDRQLCAKLADFGASRRFDAAAAALDPGGALQMSVAGTRAYCAPEILQSGRYNLSADVFSFGVSLFEVACYEDRKGFVAHLRALGRGGSRNSRLPRPPDAFRARYSALWSTMKLCISAEPRTRPSFLDVVGALASSARRFACIVALFACGCTGVIFFGLCVNACVYFMSNHRQGINRAGSAPLHQASKGGEPSGVWSPVEGGSGGMRTEDEAGDMVEEIITLEQRLAELEKAQRAKDERIAELTTLLLAHVPPEH